MATKTKTFGVTAHIVADVNITIAAASLEEAIQKAKEFKVPDFVERVGDYVDYEDVRITGVWENE